MREYDELLEREHPNPKLHARMSRTARAAQFAPFAALTGYEAELAERRRTTEDARELDATQIEELNRLLCYLADHPEVPFCVTYFVPDARKSGGKYCTCTAQLKRIDAIEGVLMLSDGKKIPLDKITKIEVYENESTQ